MHSALANWQTRNRNLATLSHQNGEKDLPHKNQEPWQRGSSQLAQGSRPTSADGPVAHVARFARAAVSLDSVGADGILITAVLPTATLVVLCLQGEK